MRIRFAKTISSFICCQVIQTLLESKSV